MLRAQHEATVLELEATHDELLRVQKRFDRLQSATVAKAEGRLAADAAPPAPDASTSAPQVNLPAANPASNGASPHTNGGSPAPVIVTATGQEMEEMRMLLANRDKDLEELRNDRVTLNRDLDMLKAKVRLFRRSSVATKLCAYRTRSCASSLSHYRTRLLPSQSHSVLCKVTSSTSNPSTRPVESSSIARPRKQIRCARLTSRSK